MKKKMRCLSFCLLVFSTFAVSTVPNLSADYGEPLLSGEDTLPCYVVIANEGRDDNQKREITILVDKNDVNELSFLRLYRHFSAVYSETEDLSVRVKSSLNFTVGQYTTVEDMERIEAGLSPKPKIWEKDAQGILMRTGEIEKFGYKAEGGDLSDMKYVLLRGQDPDCRNCKGLDSDRQPSGSAFAEPPETKDDVPCFYLIGNFVSKHRRSVGLFINREDGNEPNLLSLMRHFSRRYPNPDSLVIRIYTDRKQQFDFGVESLGDYLVFAMYEHFAAVLFREGGNRVIRYRRPQEAVTTVVVEGIDIFPGLR